LRYLKVPARLRCLLRILAASGLAVIALSMAGAQLSSDAPPIHYRLGRTVAVWLPYWMDKNGDGVGWKDIQEHAGLIDEVSFFAFAADPDTGNLSNEGDGHGMDSSTISDQVNWLHTRNVAALVTVTQFNHVGDMLSEPVRLKHLISQILDTCDRYGFDGVDVDFEDFKPGDPGDAGRYTDFVEQLATAMHSRCDTFGFPCLMVATVLPHTDRGTFQFIDYNALGKSDVDRIRVMAYDEFYPGSKLAGASAPAPWVASVGTYLSAVNAPQWKFVMGIPGYGYRWPVVSNGDWTTTGRGLSVTYPAAQQIMADHSAKRKWSDDQRTPYFGYQDGSTTWIAFYEDAESWQTKLQTIILPSKINGIADWAAGFEDPASWTVVAANFAASEPIYGAIGDCYWRFGGGARFGNALAAETDSGPAVSGTLNERGGKEQQFQNGVILYEWEQQRAYAVTDPVLTVYKAAGGPEGMYGFPVSDAVANSDGTETQQFEKGTITR
jgi:spore germination protein YaaH